MAIVESKGKYINDKTGEVYDPKEWIISDWGGQIRAVKRLTDKQLSFIESLEYQLGYKPKNHSNMAAYKAVELISRLQSRLEKKQAQLSILKEVT